MMHYDEQDKAAIQQFAQLNNVALREDQSVFSARQLEHVKAQIYSKKYPPMVGLTLVPIASDVPEWAETIVYRSYDQVGMAKVIANYADDLPRADVTGTEVTLRVKDIGDSYGYNVNELRASAALGEPLSTRKGNAARRAITVKLNQIAMVGDKQYGLQGLLTHPNIGITTLPSGKEWSNASAKEMLYDLNALWNAIRIQSSGIHTANRLTLSPQLLGYASSAYLNNTTMTAMGAFRSQHPNIQILEAPEFAGAGTGGKDLIFIGEFDAMNASLELPMPFNQLSAQARNLELVVPCLARTAGVAVHYPLAFTKAEL